MWRCSESFRVSIFEGCSFLPLSVCWYISKGVDTFILMSGRFEVNLSKGCLKLTLSSCCFRVWKYRLSRNNTSIAKLWTVVDQTRWNHAKDSQNTPYIWSTNLALRFQPSFSKQAICSWPKVERQIKYFCDFEFQVLS